METTFKLWHGRWQRQDAEWSATAAMGSWRLRPLGEEELPTLGERGSDIQRKLLSMTAQATGMIYVMVVKVRDGFTSRVPLIPVDHDRFLTLAHHAGRAGSDRVVDVHKEDFEKFAADLVKRCEPVASAPPWMLCLACAVCRQPYVTGDPILRYILPKVKTRVSAHFVCGVVRAADVLQTCEGSNVYVEPKDKLSMTEEVMALCGRATKLIDHQDGPIGPIPEAEFERFRQEMTDHLVAINSKTPYREGITAEHFRPNVAVLEDVFMSSLREAAGRAFTVRRTEERVGRNEQCPCGSGEKFKKCCGGA